MVAGILEKSKRLRKAFFIVRNSQSLARPRVTPKPRNVGRLSRRGTYVWQNRNSFVSQNLEPKRQRGARRDSRSRRRQPRRFALLDLNSFAPVLRPVSASPAREAARLKLPLRAPALA